MIKLVNVTKCFSDGSNVRYIFKNCNFEFKKGSTTAIVGRSGLGKTTLVKLILGITSLNEGDILVCGSSILDMKNLSKVRRRNIGCVFQNFNLISGFTVKENILLPRYFFENGENNINEICNTLGLSKEMLSKSIDKISGGEKQRVALARALINNPEILIADEPTGNLDAANEQNIIELLKRINEELGITIIIVTHSDKVANSMQSICTVVDGDDKMNHSILFIAKRDLEVNKRRYRLVRLSIAISVLLIVLVMLISNSFYNKMIKEMTVANKNVVTVAFGNKENSLNYKALPLFSSDDIDRVKKIDEVKNITGVKLLFTDDIKFQNGKTSVSNTIHCLEEKYLKNLNIRIAEGKFPEKDNEILIGDSVHKATSMNVGDTVTIKIDNHYEKFVISGIIDKQEAQLFSTLPTEINQMMAINVKSSSVSSNKYYYLNATVKNGTDLNEVANKIEKTVLKNENLKQSLSGTGLDVVVATQQDVINMLSRWFSYIDLFILLIIVLISIVAIINIINILAITIQENHKQIATFKIIGASDRQIKRIYLFESFMMGVRGTSAGLVIGIAISYLIIFLSGLPLDIELTRLLFPVLIGILTSVFAGLLVSRKITKIDIEKVLNQ